MRIIAKSKLLAVTRLPGMERAKNSLLAWHDVVRKQDWDSFQDAKQTYGASLDLIGDCAVFDIHGNDFRLVTRIRFKTRIVYILKVMTHKEYDRQTWKAECGCFTSPPPNTRTTKKRNPGT